MQLITSQYEYLWDLTSTLKSTSILERSTQCNPTFYGRTLKFQIFCWKLQLHLKKNQKSNENGTYYTPPCIIILIQTFTLTSRLSVRNITITLHFWFIKTKTDRMFTHRPNRTLKSSYRIINFYLLQHPSHYF